MFEHLKDYKKIFVVGLARSGTRIAAKMIAHDTSLTFVDETEWGVFELEKLKFLDKYRTNFVVQANAAYHIMPYFSRPSTLVVFVKRPIPEIRASWARINKLKSINKIWIDPSWAQKKAPEDKLILWDSQKSRIQNLIEVEYKDLAAHPLWVPEEDRKDFLWMQTVTNQFQAEEARILK
jgi:hypothetical protein